MKSKTINQILIERLKLLKKENGCSLDEIEIAIGVSKGSMSKYINGIHVPNSEIVKRIAMYFNVSTDYLLGESDSRNSNYVEPGLIPAGYLAVIKDCIALGVTEDDFKQMYEIFKRMKGWYNESSQR